MNPQLVTRNSHTELTAAIALASLVGSPNFYHTSRPEEALYQQQQEAFPLPPADFSQERLLLLQHQGSRRRGVESLMPSSGTYHIPEEETRLRVNSVDDLVKSSKLNKANKKFPEILHDILENPIYHDVVAWLPGGKAFIIIDRERFTAEILPKHFKATQFQSFARKLTRWNFTRVPKGPYAGAYYNKLFRKSSKSLCNLISCDEKKMKAKMDTLLHGYKNRESISKTKLSAAPRRIPLMQNRPNEVLRSLSNTSIQNNIQNFSSFPISYGVPELALRAQLGNISRQSTDYHAFNTPSNMGRSAFI